MNSDILAWEAAPTFTWYWYLTILFLIIFGASLLSEDMKRKNKIVFATASLVILLFLPIVQRLAIQSHIEENGYHLIVDQGIIWPQHTEVDPKEYLWQHFFYGVWMNEENKLVYVSQGKTSIYPRKLEEIQFLP